jgi:hypothetical protein
MTGVLAQAGSSGEKRRSVKLHPGPPATMLTDILGF